MTLNGFLKIALVGVLATAMFASACGGTSVDGAAVDGAAGDDAAGGGDSVAASSASADSGTADDTAADPTAAPSQPTPVPTRLTSEGEGDQADAGEIGEGEDEGSGDGIQVGGEITYGIASDGTGFNTTDAINEGSIRIISALNDPLVSIDQNGDWIPFFAEDLVSNDDFTVWTFTLRDDTRFHDGVTVDAEAVKANIDAFRAGPNVGFALALVTEVNVTGPLEVEIVMSSPWAAFPYTMFGQPGWMVSPDTIGQNDTFVGVGAFKLESWNPADTARVVRNDDYWRNAEGFPYLDAISFKVIPEQAARAAALAAGDIDAANSPSEDKILEYLEDPDVDVYIGEAAANEGVILLNTATAPTDDIRIRRAMAHALDRELIIDTFRAGLTVPANSFIEPNSPWFVETDYPAFDLDTARALVEEYEAEVGPAEITLLGRNSTSTIENADLVAALMAEVGIDVTVEPIAPGTEVLPVITDAFQAIMWAQFSALDPDGSYVFFHSSGGALNWTNLVSPAIDEGFDIGRANDDTEVRFEGYAQVQRALAEEVPMLWIDHWGGIEAVAAVPSVHGIPEVFFPDGTQGNGLVAGSYFSWEDVWVEAG